ncbi:MAG: RNA 2',3'-cyclic phosphodiesterase [Pseudomonadota bacterium]
MPEARRRLFFALWPDAAVRAALAAAGQALAGKRIKRVPADNLHLTLAFAGPVTAEVAACLARNAGAVRAAPFELCIDHAGYWPRPRILWLGPAHMPPPLWELAGALRVCLAGCGLVPEARAFQAHITVARRCSQPAAVPDFPVVNWPVSDFCLVESVPAENGSSYRPLACWPLEGG